jgi:hypothetical protein
MPEKPIVTSKANPHYQKRFDQLEKWAMADACAGRSRTTPRPARRSMSLSVVVAQPIIAAAMTGRACHAIELAPAYVDVGVKRWQDFTGEAAVLDGDGRTFDQIAAERLPQAASSEAADAA